MGPDDQNSQEVDHLGMSDEDFMKTLPPEPTQAPAAPAGDPPAANTDTPPAGDPPNAADDTNLPPAKDPQNPPSQSQEELDRKAAEANVLGADDKMITDPAAKPPVKEELGADGKPVQKVPGSAEGEGEKDKKPDAPPVETAAVTFPESLAEYSPEQSKAALEMLLGPMRANGKDLQVKSPAEAQQLMRMGFNYTKKLQALQPQMRMVTMLTNNNLDEAGLAYLLDLKQGKPEAIQKLLADSKFDPMSVDTEKAAEYVPGNAHQVSDGEVAFQAALDEVALHPTGPELVTSIAKQWDQASKQALFEDPSILSVLAEHKSNGTYDLVAAEITRKQDLGNVRPGQPYIHTYYETGQEMQAKGLLPALQKAPQVDKTVVNPPAQKQPIETRVVAPPSKVANDDKAKAASPTKAPPSASNSSEPDYLAMSDEEFAKATQGRF